MEDQIILREYKNEDIHQILELLNRNFGNQQHLCIKRDMNWWKWKYEKNIFGTPIIYVAEHNERIVGVRPFWPWKLNIRGKNLKCFQPLDSAVDKEYRGKGIFTKLTKKALIENIEGIDLIFNFPNEQSLGADLRLGWSFVGKLQWYVKINKPLNTYYLIKNNVGFKSYKLDIEDLINEEKIMKCKDNFNFDEQLKTVRRKEFLTWRYLEHPQVSYGMNIIEKYEKQLIYVYEVNENKYGRELIVLDYFGEMGYFKDLLSELNRLCKKYGIAFICMLNKYNTPQNLLKKSLYFKQKKKNFVVLPLNLELNSISLKYNSWDIFLGLHDSI